LNAPAAALTGADVDVELTEDGASGDFGLILLVNCGVLEGIATVRARVGQRSLKNDIDRARRGGQAVTMATVGGARFATGFFGFPLGRSLGKGSCLAFGLAFGLVEVRERLVEFALKPFVVLPKGFDLLAETLDECAEVVQLRQYGDWHRHGIAHLDRRHRCHHGLVTTGLPCL
jgi:hypothetical protein